MQYAGEGILLTPEHARNLRTPRAEIDFMASAIETALLVADDVSAARRLPGIDSAPPDGAGGYMRQAGILALSSTLAEGIAACEGLEAGSRRQFDRGISIARNVFSWSVASWQACQAEGYGLDPSVKSLRVAASVRGDMFLSIYDRQGRHMVGASDFKERLNSGHPASATYNYNKIVVPERQPVPVPSFTARRDVLSEQLDLANLQEVLQNAAGGHYDCRFEAFRPVVASRLGAAALRSALFDARTGLGLEILIEAAGVSVGHPQYLKTAGQAVFELDRKGQAMTTQPEETLLVRPLVRLSTGLWRPQCLRDAPLPSFFNTCAAKMVETVNTLYKEIVSSPLAASQTDSLLV